MAEVLHIFTSAAVNYLPKVRILCRSIRQYHPEAVIHLALADERPQWLRTEDEPFDSILGIEALDIPDWRVWTLHPQHRGAVHRDQAVRVEASAAAAGLPDGPVLRSGHGPVFRVDDILAALERSNLALTPHQTKPEQTLDAILDNEVCEPQARDFQPGVHRRQEHCRRPALRRLVGGTNLPSVPGGGGERAVHRPEVAEFRAGFFRRRRDHQVVPPQRRHLEPDDAAHDGRFRERIRVDGEPLGFYHFTGFDSGAHRIMAIKNASESRPCRN